VIPAVLILASVVRAVALMDELQRKIQLEAVILSFCGTAILTFSYGFLENVGFPHLNWTCYWKTSLTLLLNSL
jgi:hypothetical protein